MNQVLAQFMLLFCPVKITIVGATPYELEGLIEHHFPDPFEIDYLVHGIGAIHTTYNLTAYLSTHRPDYIIQCGIAGSFHPEQYGLNEVVFVRSDCFADLGAEDQDGSLLEMFDLDLEGHNQFPFKEKRLVNPNSNVLGLPEVNAISVNTVSGAQGTIQARYDRYKPDIETMEGAAFTYVCMHMHLPFAQIRGISNKVEPRDREAWDMNAIHHSNQIIRENIHLFLP